jgi:hypothetical protein
VTLLLFGDSTTPISDSVKMALDPASGVWSAAGAPDWTGRYYLYQVDVFVPQTGRVEHNQVTDPYSLSLSTNSRRSQIVNLNAPSLKPAGWDDLTKPAPAAPEDIVVYELHVRDFSIYDLSVPAAEHNPQKLNELVALWWAEAGRYQALPLESRDALGILTAERPQLAKPRERYLYYPGCAEVPESAAPNIRNRSYAIAVEATVDTPEASGVLFSQGSRFGGHALYVKDGKLKYVYNWVGEFEQIIESDRPVPTGDCVLSASFEKEGDAMPAEGTLSLYIDDEKVGEGKIRPSPANSRSLARG